ncbi:hypothetical protein MNBD_ALPHA11-2344 [hydrothermal vent metagenome]|uniref:Uncharacterized protein n=1 Tax=hydrothermal vent metagenome TaxID=652676 RepID=A0A3B0TLY5_9ZZZZ
MSSNCLFFGLWCAFANKPMVKNPFYFISLTCPRPIAPYLRQ